MSAPRTGAPAASAWGGLLVLLVVPLALRLWPIGHGHGTNYLADTHVVRSALGMAQERNPVPPVGRYSTYPNLLPYCLLPVYAAEYAAGRASGAWSGVGEFERAVKERPFTAHLPARVLVALLGALTPLIVFRTCRVAGLRAGATIAAWLVATGLLHLHFSVQERPWAPLAFFLALAALFAARAVRGGRARELALSGAAAGLALATHQAGLAALAIPGIAWLCLPWGWRGADLRRRLAHGTACVALFAAVALLLGHPYLLVHGRTEASAVSAGEEAAARGGITFNVGGQALHLEFSTRTLERLSRAFVGYDPVLVLLAIAGLAIALRRRPLLPATVFALGWGAFFLLHYNDHVRYLLPLSVLLAPAAGAGGEWLFDRRAGRAVLLVLLVLPLAQAVRLGLVLRRADTRDLALEWLEEHPIAGPLAVDAYGPELPLDARALERLAGLRELGSREAHRLLYYGAGLEPPGPKGIDALPVNALLELDARGGSSSVRADLDLGARGATPDEILASFGVSHVLLADRTPGDERPSLLIDSAAPSGGLPKLPPLSVDPVPLAVFDPAAGGRADEARLPTEMDFPLLGLWQVERPGPLLALHRLTPQ